MPETIANAKSQRNNNFGALRLLFALLVIVSHSPELVDGNRSHEFLTQVFGTMSFGEAAVDGFFLISGYLITKSFVQTASLYSYAVKRVLRIIPGYVASFWLCVLMIAPHVGAQMPILVPSTIKYLIIVMLHLLPPEVPGAFHGLHYVFLNGALWTIAYEFRCYIAVAILGLLGLYGPRSRWALLLIITAGLIVNATGLMHGVNIAGANLIGTPENNIRFFPIFGVGMLYYLFRDKIQLTSKGALVAGITLMALMFNKHTAEMAYALLGGYLLFWAALKLPVLSLSRLDNKTDISYGIYLYAWPVQNGLIWFNPTITPWQLCLLATLVSCLFGYLSWIIIEKPALESAPHWHDLLARRSKLR